MGPEQHVSESPQRPQHTTHGSWTARECERFTQVSGGQRGHWQETTGSPAVHRQEVRPLGRPRLCEKTKASHVNREASEASAGAAGVFLLHGQGGKRETQREVPSSRTCPLWKCSPSPDSK